MRGLCYNLLYNPDETVSRNILIWYDKESDIKLPWFNTPDIFLSHDHYIIINYIIFVNFRIFRRDNRKPRRSIRIKGSIRSIRGTIRRKGYYFAIPYWEWGATKDREHSWCRGRDQEQLGRRDQGQLGRRTNWRKFAEVIRFCEMILFNIFCIIHVSMPLLLCGMV